MKEARVELRVESTEKERWEKCAKKKTRGNLTLWSQIELNKAADRLLGKQDDINLTEKKPE